MTEISLGELAQKLGGMVEGDDSIRINGVSGIIEAGPGDISFVDNPKYLAHISRCRASAIIIGQQVKTDFRPLIRSQNPYLAFTQAIELLAPTRQKPEPGIHPSACIHSQARISPDAAILANVVIEEDVEIGKGTIVYPGVIIAADCRIEQEVTLYPNVTIRPGTVIGARSIIHSGVTLGSTEVGTETDPLKVRLEIGTDVEIGANSTIVSGIHQPTRIGRGTKLDNLVHIDHDVEIGENTVVVAMVSIEPEAKIGNEVTLAGQACIAKGIQIGHRAIIGARSMVIEDVREGEVRSGIPAISHDQHMRIKAAVTRLPKLYKKVQEIEEELSGSSKNS